MRASKIIFFLTLLSPLVSFANPIHDAIQRHSLEEMVAAIESGEDINGLNASGQTPLDLAMFEAAALWNAPVLEPVTVALTNIAHELRARGARLATEITRERARGALTGARTRLLHRHANRVATTRVVGEVPRLTELGDPVDGDTYNIRDVIAALPRETRVNLVPTLPIVRRERLGRRPETVVADGGRILIGNEGSNDVTNSRGAESIRVGEGPRVLAVDENGHLWVANHRSDTVSVVDLHHNEVVATMYVGQGPYNAVLVGRYLYVTILYSDVIAVIDTRARRIERMLEVGRAPQFIAAANGFIYVTNILGEMHIIDIFRNELVRTVPIGTLEYPPFMAGVFLFIEDQHAPALLVFDTRYNNEVRSTVPVTPGTRVIAAQEDAIFTTTRDANEIRVISWRGDVEHVISLDDAVADVLKYGDLLFVRHAKKKEITVISIRSRRVVARLPLEAYPLAMTVVDNRLAVTLENGILIEALLDGILVDNEEPNSGARQENVTHTPIEVPLPKSIWSPTFGSTSEK